MENRAQSRQIWEDAMNSQDFDHKDQRIAELERVLLEISKISQRPGFAAGLLEICGDMAREELEKRK